MTNTAVWSAIHALLMLCPIGIHQVDGRKVLLVNPEDIAKYTVVVLVHILKHETDILCHQSPREDLMDCSTF